MFIFLKVFQNSHMLRMALGNNHSLKRLGSKSRLPVLNSYASSFEFLSCSWPDSWHADLFLLVMPRGELPRG